MVLLARETCSSTTQKILKVVCVWLFNYMRDNVSMRRTRYIAKRYTGVFGERWGSVAAGVSWQQPLRWQAHRRINTLRAEAKWARLYRASHRERESCGNDRREFWANATSEPMKMAIDVLEGLPLLGYIVYIVYYSVRGALNSCVCLHHVRSTPCLSLSLLLSTMGENARERIGRNWLPWPSR